MTKTFNPAKIIDFRVGVLNRDPAKVKEALDAGIDPSTPVIKSIHPLQALLCYYGNKDQVRDENFMKNTGKIVEMLLDHGVRLTEYEKHATQDSYYLIDKLLHSDDFGNVSNLVLHAILEQVKEGKRAYQPDMGGFIASYFLWNKVRPEDDLVEHAAAALTNFENLHETVRRRLESPQTETEKELVGKYADKLDYWTDYFRRPPLDYVLGDQRLFEYFEQHQMSQEQGGHYGPAGAKGEEQDKNPFMQMIKTLPKKTEQQILAEVESLQGMEEAKKEFRGFAARAQFDAVRQEMGLPVDKERLMHTVFYGAAGTGKTTLARHRAELLHTLGFCGNRFLEITRENVVAGYVGQTEKAVLKAFEAADAIFVDETYSLYKPESPVDYGQDVINALIPILENRRGDKVVFMAGYKAKMDEFLTKANPGMASRIGYYVDVPEPTMADLGKELDRKLDKAAFVITPEARAHILEQLQEAKGKIGGEYFGNYRLIRTIVEKIPDQIAMRVMNKSSSPDGAIAVPTREAMTTVTFEDVKALKVAEKICGLGMKANVSRVSGPIIGFQAKLEDIREATNRRTNELAR